MLKDAVRSRYNVNLAGKRGGRVWILHCSCLARRLAEVSAVAKVALEPTKASRTAVIEVRGFHRRKKS